MFRPGGLIDEFYRENLRAFVEVKGGRWRWKSSGGVGIGFPNRVLDNFRTAASIRDMFFQEGGSQPAVGFKIKPEKLDANVLKVELDLAGQVHEYSHGPLFGQNMRWPSPDATGRVTLEFKDNSGSRLVRSYEGPWAWFRLLADSNTRSLSGDVVEVTMEHRGRRYPR